MPTAAYAKVTVVVPFSPFIARLLNLHMQAFSHSCWKATACVCITDAVRHDSTPQPLARSHSFCRVCPCQVALVLFCNDFFTSPYCRAEVKTVLEEASNGRLIYLPVFFTATTSDVKKMAEQAGGKELSAQVTELGLKVSCTCAASAACCGLQTVLAIGHTKPVLA